MVSQSGKVLVGVGIGVGGTDVTVAVAVGGIGVAVGLASSGVAVIASATFDWFSGAWCARYIVRNESRAKLTLATQTTAITPRISAYSVTFCPR
jgi:hypothetical protein